MNNTYFKKIAPYVLGLFILFLVNYIYFLPQFQGKQVLQGDIVSYNGAYGEIGKYWAEKGEQLFWTNAMFGGMPTFMIGVSLKSFYLDWVPRLLSFDIYYPMGVFLAQMIAFFIMTSVMGIHPLIGIIGAIAFGFTTNNFVLFEAGHNSKLGTIVFNPLVIAGLYTIYKHKKYLLGGVLFSAATANSLNANHPQMTFYFVITCVVLAIVWLVESIKEKEINHLLKTIATVIIGASISLAATSSTWLMALDYSKDSLRGKPILTEESAVNTISPEVSNNAPSSEAAGESGLGWDYAMMWSNKTQDLLSVLIPFAAGGSSGETTKEGATFKLLVDNGAKTNEEGKMGLPFYWGGLPFTSGPNYLGAVMIFLFTFGFFIEKGGLRWWALISVLLTLFLSMGQHFETLQRLFFDFVPFYNKFRAPSSILTITPFFLPILGLFAINKLCYQKYSPDSVKKALIYSFSIIGGLTLFLALFATSFFDFKGPSDGQLQPIVLTNIIQDRIDFFKADAFRSFYFIGAAAIAIFLFTRNWIKPTILIVALGFLTLLDHWTVGQRYLGKSSFNNPATADTPLKERPADKEISSLEKSRGDYRVLDLAVSTFGNSTTSFYHNTIGGYHAAKLMRYNDIIEKQISNNNQNVINMLNAKYIIKQDQTVSQNPLACGTAWFVDTLLKVNTPNEEMAALNNFNPQEVAIILDNEFKGYAGNFDPQKGGEITLTQYDPQNLIYSYTATSSQFAVFSEIWYGPDKGWQAFIDDKPVDHVRVNYLLRGLKVPEGKHTIAFRFKPVKIQQYITISRAASGLLMVALLGMIGWMGFNFYKNPGEPNPFPNAPVQPKAPVTRDTKPSPKPSAPQQKKSWKENLIRLNKTEMVTAFAPGRINLIGEHTDYNNGFVLPAAIKQKITFSVTPNTSESSGTTTALDLGETISFDLNHLTPISHSWSNYVLGLCHEIIKSGSKLTGFDCSFGGDIPIGAGLSSSAALLCSAATALDKCFNLNKSKEEWMYLTQKAEHHFVGTNCGLMDMFASLHGKENHLMLFDCQHITFQYVPFDLKNFHLILLNTQVSHQLASSEYNTRRKECEEVVSVIRNNDADVSSLRDVSMDMLNENRKSLSDTIFKRAKYVIEENARVLEAVHNLEKGDIKSLGELLYETHYGLKNDYEVSCQELDFLVSFTENMPEVAGARMMGGGFGGCTLNLVEKDASTAFLSKMKEAYFNAFGIELPHYFVEPSDGATLLS